MTTRRIPRPPRAPGLAILLAGLLLSVSGCSTGVENAGTALVDSQGNHPSAFAFNHSSVAVSNVDRCRQCHGTDLTGGIAKVSCFTAACHHGTVPGWAASSVHGAAAKRAPGNSGFASCQICHGGDFSTRLGTSPRNCFDCHGVNAPHPPGPWRSSPGLTHTTTDPANAPVCATCHFPGSANNPANHPANPAPPGTAPGCFNNTLCHGQSAAPHALGAAWRDPSVGGANFHGLTAKQDLAFCQTCHGTPGTIRFDGGVASTSCADCHPAARAHPVRWFQAPQPFPNYAPSHRDSGNRNVACAICHDVTQGRTPPDGAAPSCFSSDFKGVGCHSGGPGAPNHAVPNLEASHLQAIQADFAGNCSNCHSTTGTSPVSAAPNCLTCHTNFVSSNPLTTKNCTSCHAVPPTGTAYPNLARKHARHEALPEVAGVCRTCHNGLDPRTDGASRLAHYAVAKTKTPPGDVSILSAYNSRNATASFASLSCSNVSCHGGQAVNWDTGSIDVNTQCTACHQLGNSTAGGSPQFNVYFSGQHRRHVNDRGIACTVCHSTAQLAGVHFNDLSTPAMTQARGTINVSALNFNGAVNPPTCNPNGAGGIGGCHGGETWSQQSLP